MSEKLHELAKHLGIATNFCDAGLKRSEYHVKDKTIKFFARALGYPADTDKQSQSSCEKIQAERWHKMLEEIYVCTQDNIIIDVVSPDLSNIKITLIDKQKNRIEVNYQYLQNAENYGLFYKESLRITTPLEIGYYDIEVISGGKKATSRLAVAPDTCYSIPQNNKKIFGFAIQLYSLKSERNFGIGDFTDLQNFVKICSEVKADIIGINPINVLNHSHPENASPYMPVSRIFLNPIYIDVESVPEFALLKDAQIFQEAENLRSLTTIDYAKVYEFKTNILEKCFVYFQTSKDKERTKSYKDFCDIHGDELDNLALFQAIYENQNSQGITFSEWSKIYTSSKVEEAKKFAKEHKDRIEFFKFIQFEADRQFKKAQEEVQKSGLKIGFYRDLAVGVDKNSAEVWSNPDLFLQECGTGAPPDAFFPCGQKWGLGTFHPLKLKKAAYQPFIDILRSNMQGGGALRIDHVMSLMRLYVIPDKEEEGTYLYYNFDDMINLVALESQLNKCVVVGESIGNVPEGFLDKLASKNFYSLSILWAERWECGRGDFKLPQYYPNSAFTSVATHDIAPLKSWWMGYDITTSYQLGIIAGEEEKIAAYHQREDARYKLLKILDEARVWPEDKQRKGNYLYGEGYPEGIEEALQSFMMSTSSPVYLAQLEDILSVEFMHNVPGTDKDKYPNWRQKLPQALECLLNDERFMRCIKAIHREM